MTSAASLLRLAGSVLIGQLALIGFGVADTMMLGQDSAASLSVLAVAQAVFIPLSLALSGVMQALIPRVGQHFGAGRALDVGHIFRQGLWLALGLTAVGLPPLLWPQSLLTIAGLGRDREVLHYLGWLAAALPATLLFRAYSATNQGLSRPWAAARLQLLALAVKIGLNAALINGFRFGPLHIAAQGAVGCAAATAVVSWILLGLGWLDLKSSRTLRPYAMLRAWERPHPPTLLALLRLGVPIGLSLLIEVSAFTLMALFIARLGDTVLAGHQITANFGTVLYMLPLSISIAAGAVVAQHLGAGHAAAARRAGALAIGLSATLSVALGAAVWLLRAPIVALYTHDAAVAAVAQHLFLFIAFAQLFDAVQVTTAFVLRAYHIALAPTLLYGVMLWGVGLAGGYALAFDTMGLTPPWLQGAAGFWFGNSAGLSLVALGLLLLFAKASGPSAP